MTRRLGILLGAVLVAVLLSMRSFPRTSADVTGQKNVIVLRAYFHDYTATSRYSLPQVQGFFGDLNTLWGTRNSYGKMGLSAQVTDLIQYPSNRSAYIDDFSTGDLSNGGKFDLVLDDAIANSPAGLDWSDVDAVMVVMSETDPAQFHRGQAGTCTKKMGPAANAPLKYVGCAIFSENPSQSDLQVWGRWAHEVGHAFQEGNPPHPSNYNSSFELMDDNMPGQTGMFEKWIPGGFGGWMPHAKYKVFTPTTGGGTAAIYAEEYDPATRPNAQAVKADVTGSLYYIVSVRRRINGDELNGDFQSGPVGTRGIPDEGVLIERVVENGDGAVAGSPWVVLQGKGGDRDKLWHEGDQYQNTSDGVYITVDKKFDDDDYQVTVRYSDGSAQPDVGLYSWLSPPGNTYETTDIWIDSPINGYDTFRYGMWSDLHGGTVPKGNGDDPGVGQANRLYARVRNLGTLTATNVVVHFDVTDPPGLGINGSNGFVQLGTVTSAQFPGLASIAAGGFTDVYIDWVPDFTVTPAQLAAGRFAFHTCVRVRLDHLPNEKVFGNQDGDGQQENVGYFEATQGPGAPPGAPYTNVIRLRNNARERKAAAERTVRDYAMFASYLYSIRAYLFALDHARAFDPIHPQTPWLRSKLPPVTALAAIPDTMEMCGPRDKWPIYRFRMDMPSRAITYAGGRPVPEIERIIQDSIPILANKDRVKNLGFGYLFVGPPAARETIAYAAAIDSARNLLAVYGYRSCYGVRDTDDYARMYKIVQVLPPMVASLVEDTTRSSEDSAHRASSSPTDRMVGSKWRPGLPADSLLTLTITDDQERVIFQAPKGGAKSSRFYGVASQVYIGPTTFWVALRPNVAQLLVAGGIPESRVPASLLLLAGSIVLAIAGFALLRSELRLVSSRQRFLANVSHELRTPLQQILMFVQLLRLGRTRTEAERDRSLEIVERETHRLIALSNSVLAATKAGLQLRSGPVDVANVVQTSADFFAPLADARKMRIELDVTEPAIARGDPGAIRQILINVLDNAAKYGPTGQTITIGVRTEDKTVRLWVDDAGPGIPASEREKIWSPFVRLGGTVDDSTGGAGLGLYIVRDLATAMDAEAAISDTPAGGTRFTLILPISQNGMPS